VLCLIFLSLRFSLYLYLNIHGVVSEVACCQVNQCLIHVQGKWENGACKLNRKKIEINELACFVYVWVSVWQMCFRINLILYNCFGLY